MERKIVILVLFIFFYTSLKGMSDEILIDFEKGTENFSGYRGNEIIEVSDKTAYSGKFSLKLEVPGEKTLEGIQKVIKVEADNIYKISAYVKGSGKFMLCACGYYGWTYGEKRNLTEEWQKLEIVKYEKGNSLTIAILNTSDKLEKTTIFIDEIKIEKEKIPELPDVDVEPILIESEDYPGNSKIAKDPSCSGGAYTEGARWYWLAKDVSFPMTMKNVYIYFKCWISELSENYFYVYANGNEIYKQKLPTEKEWIWIKSGPFNYKQIGKKFSIGTSGPSKTAILRLDCIIISTKELKEEELNNISKSKLSQNKGLISIAKTEQAPYIDGILNEKIWENSIEISNFLLVNTKIFAKEQTKVYLTYDTTNLYIGFICEETCLIPENNTLGEFKKNCKENDDDTIFQDDCIVILLNPGNSTDSFYDIFINGNGVINDAFCKGKTPFELWSSRDKSWNSRANVKTKIENGKWFVEIAIPFSSFKTLPSKNDIWGIVLGRIEKHQKETSAWQPIEIGFHNLNNFGYLKFGEYTPQIKLTKFGDFYKGENALKFILNSSKEKESIRIEVILTYNGGKKEIFYNDYILNKNQEISFDFFLTKGGECLLQYKILDPSTFEIYYISPVYAIDVKSVVLKPDIKSNYGYEIYLNGEKIKEQGYLKVGLNVIGIKSEGDFKGRLKIENFVIPIDETWRFSSVEEKDWYKKEFDDNKWGNAKVVDGVVQKGYFRKILLVEYTHFWPNWNKDGLNIAQNSIQQLIWVPQGIENKTLKDCVLTLEVPKEFKITGASGYYKIRECELEEGEIIKRDGKEFKKYFIKTSSLNYQKDLKLWQDIAIFLECPLVDFSQTEIFYYFTAENGYICEIPQKLKVNILPPVNGKQPKKYIIQLWTGWLSSIDNPFLEEQMLKFFTKIGVNEVCTARNIPEGLNLKKVRLIDFNEWNIDCKPYLEKNPQDALIDFKGERRFNPKDARKNQICTTLLLGNTHAWAFVEKAIKEWVEKYKVDHVNWDYEANVFESYLSCYCEKCLNEFKKFSGIPLDKNLTPELIRKEYKKEWIEFMNMRMANLAGKMRDAVKKVNPEIKFSVYSAYQSDYNKERYGIDWKMLSDKIDLGMCGYGRNIKELEDTLNSLGKTPLVCGELVYPYDEKSEEYPKYASKATLIRRAVDSTGGILVYSLAQLDGRTFYSIGEVSRLIADYEEFFVNHKKNNSLIEVEGISSNDFVVFVYDNQMLIILINETEKERQAKILVKTFNPKMDVFDYYGNKNLGNQQIITTKIPPNDVKVFVVK
ncbi:MAG: hypothetical protein QXO40_03365 [Candidatus Aenigmatarchaeota archaeon]